MRQRLSFVTLTESHSEICCYDSSGFDHVLLYVCNIRLVCFYASCTLVSWYGVREECNSTPSYK